MDVVDRLKSLVESSDRLKDWEDKAKVMPYLKAIQDGFKGEFGDKKYKAIGGLVLGMLSTTAKRVNWNIQSGSGFKTGGYPVSDGKDWRPGSNPFISIAFGITKDGFEGNAELESPDMTSGPFSGDWAEVELSSSPTEVARIIMGALTALMRAAKKEGTLPAALGESAGCDDTADAIGGAEHYRITCPECKGVTQCRCSEAQHEGVEVVKSSVVCERCKKKVDESSDNSQAIAMEIMRQMGGQNKLKAMLGIKGYLTVGASKGFQGGLDLMFQNKVKTAPNRVEILLADNDTYTVRFYRDSKKMQEEEDVYADDLMDLFERSTGLYLTLARR
jgi:hypothetical protein